MLPKGYFAEPNVQFSIEIDTAILREQAVAYEVVPLYAAAYHPVARDEQFALDIWYEALAFGNVLPTLPLWLRGGLCMPVELEATYQRTCQEQRIITEFVQEREE